MTQQQLTTAFDYSQLDEQTAAFVQSKKQAMQKRTVLSVIADGKDLRAIKEKLGDKLFQKWICSEYWFTYRTALKRIHVAEMADANGRDESVSSHLLEGKTISELYEMAEEARRPQIEASEEDEDQQEIQGILGTYDLEMQDDTPLPDSTDIDVAALVAENQQLKEANATLEGQVQEALRQGASIDTSAPTRRYGGGGGHHKPPTKEKDGVTYTMVNYDHWETTKIRLDPGWNFEDFGMGTIDMQGGTYEIFVCDKKKQCIVPVKPHDIPSVRQEIQKLDQGLEKRYAAWKATQK